MRMDKYKSKGVIVSGVECCIERAHTTTGCVALYCPRDLDLISMSYVLPSDSNRLFSIVGTHDMGSIVGCF